MANDDTPRKPPSDPSDPRWNRENIRKLQKALHPVNKKKKPEPEDKKP